MDLSHKVRHLHLVSTKLVDSLFVGNYRSVFKGPGLEFDEVREYTDKDDIRFIDWNVSSRMGSPYTKVFREERELVLQVLVDLSLSLMTGVGIQSKRETAGKLFSLLAFAAVANNDRVGTLLFSDGINQFTPPKKGKKHVLRQIRNVLSANPLGRGTQLSLAIRTTSEAMKRRGICVILSDFRTSHYWHELSLLARKHDVIAIKITDPIDRHYPKSGLVELLDPETNESILGYGHSQTFRDQYKEFWEKDHEQWISRCRKMGIDILEVSTQDAPEMSLKHFFDRRRKS